MGIRIIAILIGLAIMFSLQNWLVARWYISVSLGLIAYLITRYIGWAINERRSLNREKSNF